MTRAVSCRDHCIKSLIFLFVILAEISFCQAVEYGRKVDKSTIFYLFKNKGFGHLNSKLIDYQKEYDENYAAEENIYYAYDVFSKADASFESILNEWIKQFPSSAPAYIARAKYYCACAWQIQRHKWSLIKEGKEYEEMEKYFTLAQSDIANALKQDAASDLCYAMQIEIATATGNTELAGKALSEGLKHHPYSYRLRLQYMQILTPRWGGSYQAMQTFVDTSEKYYELNQNLKRLSASIPADKGRTYAYLGKYDHAVKMFTEALKNSDSPAYYIERGDAYAQQRNYKFALADYEKALRLSPNDPDYLERKSNIQGNIASINRTQKINTGAIRRDGGNPSSGDRSLVSERQDAIDHLKKGNAYVRNGRFEEAIPEYDAVIRLSPGEYSAYYYRALCYQRTGNQDAALQDLLKSVELKPDDIGTCYRIMRIYADRKMYDEALYYVNKVISVDPENGEAFYNRSRINEMKGSNVEALDDMRQACNLGYDPACRYYKQVK